RRSAGVPEDEWTVERLLDESVHGLRGVHVIEDDPLGPSGELLGGVSARSSNAIAVAEITAAHHGIDREVVDPEQPRCRRREIDDAGAQRAVDRSNVDAHNLDYVTAQPPAELEAGLSPARRGRVNDRSRNDVRRIALRTELHVGSGESE